jgi:hypothetical protein
MDSLILMGESLCRVDPGISLHLTIPDAPAPVRAWAETRPEVELSTERVEGLSGSELSGWNIKPSLLLQELDKGWPEVLWLDSDLIVTRPVSTLVRSFPADHLILAEEWVDHEPIPVAEPWGLPSARPIPVVNNCFIRVTQAHRAFLERWKQMLHDLRYREAQAIPYDQRPTHLLHDGWPLIALLECDEFSRLEYSYIRRDGHIAQCAGSSGYRPVHRIMDLFRGLPVLIHGLGRKPWESNPNSSGLRHFLLDLATDVSPYVLASRKVANGLKMNPRWTEARTLPGRILRGATNSHPGMAGLPMAVLHSFEMQLQKLSRSKQKKS